MAPLEAAAGCRSARGAPVSPHQGRGAEGFVGANMAPGCLPSETSESLEPPQLRAETAGPVGHLCHNIP
ncbi:unnamed protein product [Gadus morhua 'NCC']